ncbi:3283_t:CDS:2, partial [Diversispora eburnea]
EQGMLTALLNSRFKELEFASDLLHQEAELQLVSSNSLLTRIFQNNVVYVDEVANYLALPQYLTIPATSTLSERLFNEAGNVMTLKRIQMLPNT